MRLAVHAEWTKLRTSPGTVWLLVCFVLATVALSAFAAATVVCRTGDCGIDKARLGLSGVQLGQAVVAILGVTVLGGEHATGMIRVTLAALPRRANLLAAKAMVLSLAVAAASALAVAGCLIVGSLSLEGGAMRRAAFGSVLYLTLVGLLALGLAALVRNPAAAAALVLGLLYLFPIMAQAASDEKWQKYLLKAGPMSAGLAIQATTNLGDLAIAPWKGLGVLGLWAAGALLLGGLALHLRDA